MISGEFAPSEEPLFSGYGDPRPFWCWQLPEEALTEEEQDELSKELSHQIQEAAHGLEELGVEPSYDYRDIELHYHLTDIEMWSV